MTIGPVTQVEHLGRGTCIAASGYPRRDRRRDNHCIYSTRIHLFYLMAKKIGLGIGISLCDKANVNISLRMGCSSNQLNCTCLDHSAAKLHRCDLTINNVETVNFIHIISAMYAVIITDTIL